MNKACINHDQAMDLAFLADRAKAAGDIDTASRLYRQALNSELAALDALHTPSSVTLAVMRRSAAWLALDCGDTRRAEQLASAGLAEDPPPEVADELRHVWEQANFHRHLRTHGLDLSENEIEITLSGPGVGSGVAEWAAYRKRVDDTLKMITRITERKSQKPFRRNGPPDATIRNYTNPHISLPRAASYAVSIRLGGSQMYLPGTTRLPTIRDVLHEFLTIIEKVNESKEDQLSELIPDSSYRLNALGLAKQVAPDGKDIKQVGFTLFGIEKPRSVGFTRPAKELLANDSVSTESQGEVVEIRGTLLFADARGIKNTIRIVDENNVQHEVKVAPEMMDDIVRPLWNSMVLLRGVQCKNKIILSDIQSA